MCIRDRAHTARNVLASMSDIVWAINPRHDYLSDLLQRIRRFASDLFAARDIDFAFRTPGADQDLKLSADMRREIYLVFKEAVNNVVRHSDCCLLYTSRWRIWRNGMLRRWRGFSRIGRRGGRIAGSVWMR